MKSASRTTMVWGASKRASAAGASRLGDRGPQVVASEAPKLSNSIASGINSNRPILTSGLHIIPLEATSLTQLTS